MNIPVTTPNIDAERRCLSAMMKDARDVFTAVSAGLSSEHFTVEMHRAVFVAITAAAADTQQTGVESILARLTTLDGKTSVPLPELLAIDNAEATSINARTYVEAVLASSRKRALLRALTSAFASAKQDATSWPELWAEVAPHIEAAQATTTGTTERSLAEICANVKRELQSPETKKLTPTGLHTWDKNAGALRAGEMITVAARPGCGKTAIAVQIAHHSASAGKNVAFFSLEMSGEELVSRIALMRAGRLQGAPVAPLIAELDAVAKMKTFHVFDNQDAHTLASIEARCRLLNTVAGGLSLVVVDYLQLVEPSDMRAPREQQVAQMSRRFKKLAGSLKCPVMILAQLNRESEKEERRPRLSDLRESGAIEQDSDRVWFLWNDTKNGPQYGEEQSEIDVQLIQAKCRGGRPNIATPLRFNRPCFSFTQIAAV